MVHQGDLKADRRGGHACRLAAGALAAGLVLAALGRAGFGEAPPLDQLVGFFDSVALQDDTSMFGSAGTMPKRVSRWEQPIVVHIAGSISESMEDRLKWHLERFRLLAGVDVTYVELRDQANLRIILTSAGEVAARSGSADTLCLTQYGPSSGAIDYADIYIPVAQTVWLDNCMAHELMHAVGFYAHPKDNDNRSVLEQGAPPRIRTFTALDAAGIRMLYDPRLRVGLARERALPIARIIAEELLARWPDEMQTPRPGEPLGPDGFVPLASEPAVADDLAAEAMRTAR
ncbi:MAG: DUF2927 domain-containing protein [Alphaproteobacteria bacterium]